MGTELCEAYLRAMKKAGAEKAQCFLSDTKQHLMTFESGRVALFRTSHNVAARLVAISGGRQGSLSVSGGADSELESTAESVTSAAASSPADPAFDIAPFAPAETFDNGVVGPDPDGMYSRIAELLSEIGDKYPKINFRTAYLSFQEEKKTLKNSVGVNFESRAGRYELLLLFCSRDGEKTSPFNHFVACSRDLSAPLIEWGGMRRLLEQSCEQLKAEPLNGKFEGDILVSPECMEDFLRFVTEDLIRDGKVIPRVSGYSGKLGGKVAAEEFSLYSLPVSPGSHAGYFITKDGFRAENVPVIEKGVLKTFLLSQYGANKTGFAYSRNDGDCYAIGPGKDSFPELVSSIKKGVLVTRFSGAVPNEKGDFSGVAKCSFYVEDGKIRFPLSEAMLTGNVAEMLLNIKGISRERVSSGYSSYPWIVFSGITVSGR